MTIATATTAKFVPMQQAMMPAMMARLTVEMQTGQAICRLAPAPGFDAEAFQNSCDMMQSMLKIGMPMALQCGNLCLTGTEDGSAPAIGCNLPAGMMVASNCTLRFEIANGAMQCVLKPGKGMDNARFDHTMGLVNKMMRMGLPMMINCNGAALMCCSL